MTDNTKTIKTDHPFSRSTTFKEKYLRLLGVVNPADTMGILINADPDAMASALALKRLFWRKVKKAIIYHINSIQRADNLAFINHLKIEQQHIKHLKRARITKWAIVDSQPHHHDRFRHHRFDIIIDHHPLGPASKAQFVDIKANCGANSTIMTAYIRAANIKPSPRLATALFYGIKTDTDNFVRESCPDDINAFRYLYRFANKNIIKKIETSEMTKQSLAIYRYAMDNLTFVKDIAFVHIGEVENPDFLVIIADFFMKLAEARWSIASGVCDEKLIIILRNADFRGDAGRVAGQLFGRWSSSAGGHRTAARAEIPLKEIIKKIEDRSHLDKFVLKNLKEIK